MYKDFGYVTFCILCSRNRSNGKICMFSVLVRISNSIGRNRLTNARNGVFSFLRWNYAIFCFPGRTNTTSAVNHQVWYFLMEIRNLLSSL